jgi:hypothetical protein
MREIGVVDLRELLAVTREHQRAQHRFDLILGKRSVTVDRRDLTVGAQHRRQADAQVQVRCFFADESAKKIFDSL